MVLWRQLPLLLVLGACNHSPVTLGGSPAPLPPPQVLVVSQAVPSPGQALRRTQLPVPKGRPVLSSDPRCAPGWHRESWPQLSLCSREDSDLVVILAVSITPLTSLSGSAAGLSYSGDAYEVKCAISGTATLYPALYDSTLSSPGWTYYPSFPCSLDSSQGSPGTCVFPARVGSGQTFNAYKTGSGTVSSCTAAVRSGSVPAPPISPAGSSSGGTVTSITCGTGLTCTPDPITTTGSVALSNTAVAAGTYGSATQVPVFAVNAQGQLTSVTNTTISGSSPGGSATGDLSGTYPGPTVAKINGATLGTTTATARNILVASAGNQWTSVSMSGDASISSTGYLALTVPSAYADLMGWYRADQQQVADGATVPTWWDLSSRNNTLTGTSLVYSATGLNGAPTMTFDGAASTGALNSPACPSGQLGLTILAAVKVSGTTSGGGTTGRLIVALGPDSSALAGLQFGILDNGAVYSGDPNGSHQKYTNGGVVTTGSYYILGVSFAVAAWGVANPVLYLNGSAVAAPNLTGAGGIQNVNPTKLYIGSHNGIDQYWDGLISEVQLYAGARTSSEVATLTTQMQARWGI